MANGARGLKTSAILIELPETPSEVTNVIIITQTNLIENTDFIWSDETPNEPDPDQLDVNQ